MDRISRIKPRGCRPGLPDNLLLCYTIFTMSVADEGRRRVGAVLAGKWTLIDLVGAGGMGTVYRAQHRNGSKVAIKILHPHLVRNRCLVARFEKEARLANHVEHAGIVRVFDDGVTDDGCPFMVTELVEGQTLETLRVSCGGSLPIADVAGLGRDLLSILRAAHGCGVLHRDIKPANLIQTPQGELKILDFGLGCESDPTEEGLTSAQAVLGTVGFMAPEQAQGRWDLVDEQTDLWSAGATLLKLLTGLDAHEGQTPQERLAFAATRPIARLADRASHLSPRVQNVLVKAMAFSKRDRFASAGEMLGAWDEALACTGSPPATQPRRAQRTRAISLAVGVFLVAGTLGLFGTWKQEKSALEVEPSLSPLQPGETGSLARDSAPGGGAVSSERPDAPAGPGLSSSTDSFRPPLRPSPPVQPSTSSLLSLPPDRPTDAGLPPSSSSDPLDRRR